MSTVDRNLTRPDFYSTRRERVRMRILRDFRSSMSQSAFQPVDASALTLSAPAQHRCGVLSDGSIIESVDSGLLGIDPFDINHVQPSTYDLTLLLDKPIWIFKGKFYLLSSRERIRVPRMMRGQVHGRSSLARLGLAAEFAGFIDPGFDGQITFEAVALADPVELRPGDRIAQIEFTWLDRPAMHPYNGRYQGQIGPTPSRFGHGDN